MTQSWKSCTASKPPHALAPTAHIIPVKAREW